MQPFSDGRQQYGASFTQQKSTVVIEKKQNRLKTGDVALYRRPAGEYVLHRVVKVLDGAYLICGDNRLWKETVPEEWVIGVMVGYYQTEADDYVPCTEENVRRYLKKYSFETLPVVAVRAPWAGIQKAAQQLFCGKEITVLTI